MALFNREPEKSRNTPPVQAFDSPPPQTSNSVGGGTCLDLGTKVRGELFFAGSAQIDGKIGGRITATDTVIFGATAMVTADVKAGSIVVGGTVRGNITGSRSIEILASGRVTGNLAAPILVVQAGALLEGRCSMPQKDAGRERKVIILPQGNE
jgi:cytoskeletal protein CcmA (bactofilin family)